MPLSQIDTPVRARNDARPVFSGERTVRLGALVREIAIGGLAGLLAGVLVIGLGGRLFMRIAAAIDPSALGSLTSNGNRIGDITLEGTVAFVVFVGPVVGVLAAVVWVVVAPWVPGSGAVRALANGVVSAALGSILVVRSDELDFRLVGPPALVIAMLVGLIAILGVVVGVIDDRLRGRLPPARTTRSKVAYLALNAVGLMFLPLVILSFFNAQSSTDHPPTEVGVSLLVVGVATATWWVLRIREVPRSQPPALLVMGRGALLIAVTLGAARLAAETSVILARAAP